MRGLIRLLTAIALTALAAHTQSADAPASLPQDTGMKELKLPDAGGMPPLPALPAPSSANTAMPVNASGNSALAPLPSPGNLAGSSSPTANSTPPVPKIDTLPPALPAPPIMTLPPLPGMTTPAAAPAEVTAPEVKKAPSVATVKPAKHLIAKKHYHRQVEFTNTHDLNYFRSERLPATIYKKTYDKLNKQLPVAYYERDYNGLVFLTARQDNLNGLRAMLDAGRSTELKDGAGDTPLLVAVKHNAINAARLLLARHANYRVRDAGGMTPLEIARKNGNYPMVGAIEAASNTSP